MRVRIAPALAEEETRSFLLVNLVEPLLENRQFVLLQ